MGETYTYFYPRWVIPTVSMQGDLPICQTSSLWQFVIMLQIHSKMADICSSPDGKFRI